MGNDTFFGALAVTALAIGNATAQDFPEQKIPHVFIEVDGDQDHTIPHTINIEVLRRVPPRNVEELEKLIWIATRVSERGTDHITSEECPSLREVALAFRELPPIQNETSATLILTQPRPIGPTLKDGFGTSITFRVDSVQATAQGGLYAIWGNKAVDALLDCWEPLIPEGSSRYWERVPRRDDVPRPSS